MQEMYPILNKVVVRPEETRTMTEGGLYIPETAQKRALVGYVVAKGPDVETIEIGDKVFYDEYAGTNISVDKVLYVAMLVKDIFMVLKEVDPPKEEADNGRQTEEQERNTDIG